MFVPFNKCLNCSVIFVTHLFLNNFLFIVLRKRNFFKYSNEIYIMELILNCDTVYIFINSTLTWFGTDCKITDHMSN
jgi:hypothetical protein